MAGKRSATSELNHDNWNDEETPEEAGTFSKASEDVLQKRVIKAARRRVANSGDGTPKTAFGGFTGFKSTTAPAASPFSFLASTNTTAITSTPVTTNTFTSAISTSNGSSKIPANGTDNKEISVVKTETAPKEAETKTVTERKDGKIFQKSSDYFAKLKGLNESVSQWIKTHVDSNPYCILTPIFRDYERYLNEIESKHAHESATTTTENKEKSKSIHSTENTATVSSFARTDTKAENLIFGNKIGKSPQGNIEPKSEKNIFGNVNAGKSVFSNAGQNPEAKGLFSNMNTEKNPFLNKSFGGTEDKNEIGLGKGDQKLGPSLSFPSTGATATFSFGQSAATSTASAGFSFGGGKPFSFGNVKVDGSEEKKGEDEKDEEDEPPKVEFKPVTEEGAIYEQRCKVFVKKDGNYADRGVGTLFLKPTPNGKTQLIVRADTSLGNLLLNTLLTESSPTQRMGKNNVMMVCLPTPDAKPPPTPVLLRVKTGEDADALLEVLNKHKK